MKHIVLYNPLSCSGRGQSRAKNLKDLLHYDILAFRDLTKIEDLPLFFRNLEEEGDIILCGGDGTLNQFVNRLAGQLPHRQIWYYATGSGNDFLCDIGKKQPVLLNPFLSHLPSVEVNGEKRLFLNGVGYGLDGYCCEEGDRQRQESDQIVNYTKIALKGLAKDFSPVNAVVTVDGVTRSFEKVWLAPTMYGKFYGGGLKIAPGQDRKNPEGLLSLIVVHSVNRAGICFAFPTILMGAHVKLKPAVTVLRGKDISVTFDRPCALQIDGETVSGVTSYHAVSGITDISKEPAESAC